MKCHRPPHNALIDYRIDTIEKPQLNPFRDSKAPLDIILFDDADSLISNQASWIETIFNLRILKGVLKISINIFLIDRLRNGSIRDLSIFFFCRSLILYLEKMYIHIYLSSKGDFYLAFIPSFLLFTVIVVLKKLINVIK